VWPADPPRPYPTPPHPTPPHPTPPHPTPPHPTPPHPPGGTPSCLSQKNLSWRWGSRCSSRCGGGAEEGGPKLVRAGFGQVQDGRRRGARRAARVAERRAPPAPCLRPHPAPHPAPAPHHRPAPDDPRGHREPGAAAAGAPLQPARHKGRPPHRGGGLGRRGRRLPGGQGARGRGGGGSARVCWHRADPGPRRSGGAGGGRRSASRALRPGQRPPVGGCHPYPPPPPPTPTLTRSTCAASSGSLRSSRATRSTPSW
jgi:hypothetical protein